VSREGTYGDHVEITAAGRLFGVGVIIHQESQAPWIIEPPSTPSTQQKQQQETPLIPKSKYIQLFYHDYEHYSSIKVVGPPQKQDEVHLSSEGTSVRNNEGVADWKIDRVMAVTMTDMSREAVEAEIVRAGGDVWKAIEVIFANQTGDTDMREKQLEIQSTDFIDVSDSQVEGDSVPNIKKDEEEDTEKVEPESTNTKEATSTSDTHQDRQTHPPVIKPHTPKHVSSRQRKADKKKERKEKALAKKRGGGDGGRDETSNNIPHQSSQSEGDISILLKSMNATFI
jgi:hypothetical protein